MCLDCSGQDHLDQLSAGFCRCSIIHMEYDNDSAISLIVAKLRRFNRSHKFSAIWTANLRSAVFISISNLNRTSSRIIQHVKAQHFNALREHSRRCAMSAEQTRSIITSLLLLLCVWCVAYMICSFCSHQAVFRCAVQADCRHGNRTDQLEDERPQDKEQLAKDYAFSEDGGSQKGR